ncbi:META domain-containing protein [Streptomyces sp. CC228A]|uniref:META domain-containing protein n=1 Tax=Streptomyces sp. CC228A TaxID=2898186 RepID=UPI001F45D8BD|nr:META domain-containing protein [Streptomyces sp. CC228A]
MRITKQQHPVAAVALAAALLVLTAACGTAGPGGGAAPGPDPAPPPLHGVHWTVDSVTVDGARTSAPTRTPHVEFSPGAARGSLGCNAFTSEAATSGDTVRLTELTRTERACDEPVQRFEELLARTLTGGALRTELAGGRLTLRTEDGDTIALSEEPPAELTGTTWTVDGLLAGPAADDTASGLPVGTDGLAHLTLGADGQARGSLGCNTFTAEVTVTESPGTLVFSRIATTRKLCGRPSGELEERLLAALRSGPLAYRIQHRALTATAPDGTGFTARAEAPATTGTPTGTPAPGTPAPGTSGPAGWAPDPARPGATERTPQSPAAPGGTAAAPDPATLE